MFLKQLEYFVSVVEHNSFTQAACEQYISQSAISQQIKALELSLGVTLMIREKRSFQLTPAGEYLYYTGKQMIQRLQDIQNETVRIGNEKRKVLRVGYLNRYSGLALQQVVIRMNQRYRDLDLRMYGGSHSELMSMLEHHQVDIIFNDLWQAEQVTYESYPIATATTVVEVAKGYTEEGFIELKDIQDLPLILICSEDVKTSEEIRYRKYMNYAGSFIYARTLEEARFLVAANQGILLVDRFKYLTDVPAGIERKRIIDHGKPIEQDYYFYMHKKQTNTYTEPFKDIFLQVLDEF